MFSSWNQGDTILKKIYRTLSPHTARFTSLATVFIDPQPTITGSDPTAYFGIWLWLTIKTLVLFSPTPFQCQLGPAGWMEARKDGYANLAGVWDMPTLFCESSLDDFCLLFLRKQQKWIKAF